ncbi:hypothetical protein BJ165DRAFT_1419329 [Panaeolus papilionaceus]|nr:hypothetical protein BJ165DRAFT_1419329 [Panaeolus papilionaceus]
MSEYVKLKPDLSNWTIYADMFKARLNRSEWGDHLDPRSPTYLPPPGRPGTSQQEIYKTYMRIEGDATIMLSNSVPASVYSQIAGEETLLKKWEKLKELHEAKSQRQAISSAIADDEDQMAEIDEAEEASISPYTEKSIIIDYLKHSKYTPAMSVLSHLTHLKVLREGLINRRRVLSDSDFLEYVRDSFPPGSQYQKYLKAVTTRTQGREDDDGPQGGDQRPKLNEVFGILVELEKQEKPEPEAQALKRRKFTDKF